jgi:DNA-binding GntR family transcriptional regulator
VQVAEILELRALLEPFAYERAIRPRIDALASRLQGTLNAMTDRIEKGDLAAIPGLHGDFHGALYTLSRHGVTANAWSQLEGALELHLQTVVVTEQDAQTLMSSHRRLAEELTEGFVADGRRAVLRHILTAAKHLDQPLLSLNALNEVSDT